MSLASGEAEDAADVVAACCLLEYDRIAPKGAKPAIRSDGRCVVDWRRLERFPERLSSAGLSGPSWLAL